MPKILPALFMTSATRRMMFPARAAVVLKPSRVVIVSVKQVVPIRMETRGGNREQRVIYNGDKYKGFERP